MKKFYIIVSLIFFVVISVISLAKATQPVLKGSVTAVPNEMYGLWRVVSKRIDTDSPITFKEKGVDLWNLSVERPIMWLLEI